MIKKLFKKARYLIFGRHGGMTYKDIRDIGTRNPFSEYLRFKAYDASTNVYLNNDDTIGYLWECCPLVYAGEDVFRTLEALYTLGLPNHTVMQFVLHADPYVNHVLDGFKNTKDLSNDLCRKSIEEYIEFLKDAAIDGMDKCLGVPLRNYRLFVSVKLKYKEVGLDLSKVNDIEKLEDILNEPKLLGYRDSINEILKGAKLSPKPMEPEAVIRSLGRIFNDRDFDDVQEIYRPDIPINKQIILAETPIKKQTRYIDVGKKRFMCLTPKNLPQFSNPFILNHVLGGIRGPEDDSNQIHQPFIVTCNVFFDGAINNATEAKCNLALVQKGVGSFALAHEKKKAEFIEVTDDIHKGIPLVRIVPIIWIYGYDYRKVREATERARRLFQQYGFVMQQEMMILPLLLIDAMPMGFQGTPDYINLVERYHTIQPKSAAHFLPVQSDFAGGAKPSLVLMGRKGQLVRFDIFDKSSAVPPPNQNFLCLAQSGSGKSLYLQYVILCYYLQGTYIRIIDCGHSYRKLCNILGGTYLSFGPDSGIVINPFSNVSGGNIDNDISMITSIVQQMIFCSSKTEPDINATTLIRNACRWAFGENGSDATINDVYSYLSTFPDNVPKTDNIMNKSSSGLLAHLTVMAQSLAYNLHEFTSEGSYGKFFNGKSNLNISEDPFVVTDIQELKTMQDLFSVVTMQVVNAITYDTYNVVNERNRLILFDESYQFLDPQYAMSLNTNLMASVIAEGFRRARKTGSSFSIISQSILDMGKFGPIGEVLWGNSATKFFLASKDYEKAKDQKWLDYHPFIFDIIKSIQTPRPRYSELFIDSPIGQGVARLVLNDFLYWLFTSDNEENKIIYDKVRQGKTYLQAIEEIVEGKTRSTHTLRSRISQYDDEDEVNQCVNF